MAQASALAVEAFFHEPTNTVSYLIWDRDSSTGAIVDPVLDFDHKSGKASTASTDKILARAEELGLRLEWVLETHVHADHLTSSRYIKAKTGAKVGIGERIREVQRIFRPVFNLEDVSDDGREFDALFADGETFSLGGLEVRVMHTPGHTPACATYLIDGAAFVGDTLFMPDYGTARADFPGGDARELFRSIQSLLALPPETRLFMCHDYKAPGRDEYAWETTVAEERENVHLRGGVSEDEYVKMRTERDATLSAPLLLLPSIQVNIRAGDLPPAEDNGVRYLKIPVDLT
jgi:glyoxylase-like metal-dependent hydrolase (beta-lactamase superfamily II)